MAKAKNKKLEAIEGYQKQLDDLSSFEHEVEEILHHVVAKKLDDCDDDDKFKILSYAVRSRILDKWLEAYEKQNKKNSKKVYYLSLEFLIGRLLQNNAVNIDVEDLIATLLEIIGKDVEDIYEQEDDAGLGNGGLGRLAACFLDSMATLGIPGTGFGLRYEYGIFKQKIENGWQIENADKWLTKGYPWEIKRLCKAVKVKFYGNVEYVNDARGGLIINWKNAHEITAVPYDILVPGYKNNTVNLLTLWSAHSNDEFDLESFNSGDYVKAVQNKAEDETISKVLYPSDSNYAGRELRLKQQYFFVSASLQTILSEFWKNNDSLSKFPDKVAIQLNDTHPAIAVPELMRLLVDESNLEWDEAWDITTRTFAYTNHTLLPEALEKWPEELLRRLLPRHLDIIYEINRRFMEEVEQRYPGNGDIKSEMSIFDESGEKSVRMAFLAVIGSHSVNGVAKLHSELLKSRVFPAFNEFYPGKFNNKTNGVTQRRWMKVANPELAELISSAIGEEWITDLDQLKKLEKHVDDEYFCSCWDKVKFNNKTRLADYCRKELKIDLSANTMFDGQFKRIHEYKRQLLKVFHVIHRYFELKEHYKNNSKDLLGKVVNPFVDEVARTVLIGGKAAPSYHVAKQIIKLINDVSNVINNDSETNQVLKLFFIPNYGVSLAEKIIPATELSEQISTAGTEASGTGNMKFAMNGALTIGTLDGANIEIKDEVGDDNIFIFGLKTEEVFDLKANGYSPENYYNSDFNLKRVIDAVYNGYFNSDDSNRYKGLIDSLFNNDQYMIFADFKSYIQCQRAVDSQYKEKNLWIKKSIINTANMGYFSSDRTINEYAKEIWGV